MVRSSAGREFDDAQWCTSRCLQLNSDKTEVIWFGSKTNFVKLKSYGCSLAVGSETVQPASVVRDLGVLPDSQLTMKQHINKVTAACYYQLRRLRQIRRRVGTEVTTQLLLALVTSRLDYCNSVLIALPQSALEPLQRVRNTAARLIFNLGKRERVSPCLIQLHWLPIRYYLQVLHPHAQHPHQKVSALSGYLADIVQPTSSRAMRSGLRLSETDSYTTPRLRTKFGERAFSFSGPASWNSLPAELRII